MLKIPEEGLEHKSGIKKSSDFSCPWLGKRGGSLTLSAGSNNIKPLPAGGKLEQGAKRGEKVVRPEKPRAETKRWNQEKRYKARSNHAQIIFHAHVFP